MDQIRIGSFIKDLRKEKGLTQEQLAEQFHVSRRTVSRWETASNMPDLDLLVEMADYFDVDLRELLDGERKSEKMNKDLEETVLKVADYSNEEKRKITRNMHVLFIAGSIANISYVVMSFTGHEKNFLGGLCLGISSGMVLVGVIMTSRFASRIRCLKQRILHRQ